MIFCHKKAIKGHKKAIKGHKRLNKAKQDHTRTHKAMLILMRPHIVYGRENQHQDEDMRPHKAIQGKHGNLISQLPQKHIFCSLAQFLFDLKPFSLMFPLQEEE